MLRNRIKILRNLVLIAFAIIAGRLFILQIIEHGAWQAKAEKQHTLLETITAKRGEIYMMDQGEPVPVVLNQTTYQVVIDPTVTDKDKLKNVLERHAKDYITADIDEIYKVEGLRYYVVAKKIPREIAIKIAEEETPAIWLKKTNQRVYTEGEMASSTLGFVNADGIGQYGIEGALNKELSGNDGLLKTTADINKVALSIGNDNTKIPAEDGANIVLSIDRGLEKGVEEITAATLAESPATNATVLIMNPQTGEVLTIADLPNYNPGEYGKVEDASIFLNYATEVPYEPASICKTFTFSAALNEGVMTPETTYFNQGYEMVDGWKINNAEQRASLYGTLNMRTALYWSLNTGSIYALKLLGGDASSINQTGREKLYDYYYNKFRLGHATGIELIEAEGYIQDPNEGWGRDSVYANMTFGQNLGITMIQTATAFSAVVNGGYYRTPYIVKGTMKDGELVEHTREDVVEERIISSETSASMREMLMNNRSYKLRAGIDRDGYEIGGKSGTAQVVKSGSYEDVMGETVGSYIGYIAAEGELPKYVIMVKMWGEGQHIEGTTVSLLFDSISNFLIDYLKVKPGA